MGQRSKGITLILKFLVRGEAHYISKLKLLMPLLIILFSVLSLYNSYMNNMGIVLFGSGKEGFYYMNNNKTLHVCNMTPLVYVEGNLLLLGINKANESNCSRILGVRICHITCNRSILSGEYISSSIVLREDLERSLNAIIVLVKVLVLMIIAISAYMLSYENTVTTNRIAVKLKHWNINVKTTYITWTALSIFMLVFISMSIGIVVATISSFVSSLIFSTIYMKPLLSLNDILVVFSSIFLSSILGTATGLKGLEKCCI